MNTTIDLSRLPVPAAIAALDFEGLLSDFTSRFLAYWDEARATDPSLPAYDVDMLETDPVVIVGQAWSYLRLLDRQRVNDAIKAVLAPLASGTNLDHIVARQGITRQVTVPATQSNPAVMETDAQLLRRYLLSFDRAAAGSRDRYLFEAYSADPALLDVRVNGFDVHRRRGDTDVVIIGPDSDPVDDATRDLVSAAVRAPKVKPEAVSVAVLRANRTVYDLDLTLTVGTGPDAELVRQEAESRIRKACAARMVIGGQIPQGFVVGAAYGESVVSVTDNAPLVIAPDPYTVPVLGELSVGVEVVS